MKIEVGSRSIADRNGFLHGGRSASRGPACEQIINLYGIGASVVVNMGRPEAGLLKAQRAETVNGTFGAGVSHAVPEPLLIELVRAVHRPVKHAQLPAQRNV